MKEDYVKDNPLEKANLLPLIAKYSIPSIISILVMTAYNITDQIFIGNIVGVLGNAATNVAFPILTFTIAFAQLTGVGTAANFNINMGARKKDQAKIYLGTGLTMMVSLAIIIVLFAKIFTRQILLLSGATENVYPLAMEYLSITARTLGAQLITTAGSMLIRADGSPTYSMVVSVSGALLNVFLDYLFMVVFGMGIKGAALATVIGQLFSLILCISYFFRFKSVEITKDIFGLSPKHMVDIAKLGTGNFINHIIMMTVNILLNNTLKNYGALSAYGSDIPLAVSGVVAKLNMILISFSVGLSHGCQPILGFNMGAKNYDRVKETYMIAAKIVMILSFITFFIFQKYPRQVASIFGSGDELYYEFAIKYIKIFMFMVCVEGIQPITVNYFTSTGKVSQSIIVSLSKQGFLLIPLLLILPKFMGMDGVLIAGPISDFGAFVLAVILIYKDFKKLDRLKEENA
jgi:putative MATE family efflux protein